MKTLGNPGPEGCVEEDHVVTVSHLGYIKRSPLSLYRRQRRGGRGRTGMHTKGEDFVENVFVASTHSTILVVTHNGRAHALNTDPIGRAEHNSRGTHVGEKLRETDSDSVEDVCQRIDREGCLVVLQL